MIISSWNVNSIRARILNVQEYLKKFNPDVVLVQEIKTQDETFLIMMLKKLNMKVMYLDKKVTTVLQYSQKKIR